MRSLADDLRRRSDEELAALVIARPDLLQPVPPDVASLARRAGAPPSVAACLRRYDQLTLHVVLAAALDVDPLRPTDLIRRVGDRVPGPGAAARVRAAVDRLRADAVLWGQRQVHLVGPARDLLVPADRGPRVAALDPVVAGYAADPPSLRATLASAPQGVQAVLDRLLAGPVIGSVSDARRVPSPGRSPVDWLLAAHVLIPLGGDRVVLPAEVVTIMRDRSAAEPVPMVDLAAPAPSGVGATARPADPAAVGAILDVLHRVGELGRTWAGMPPSRVRAGGIGVRDLARTARAIGGSEPETVLLIEVAAAAGLVATDPDDPASTLPTARFDTWLRLSPPEQHAALLRAWLTMPRPASATSRPLAPEEHDARAAELRSDVLRVLASAPGSWQDDDVVRAVDWWAPRRHDPSRADQVATTLHHCRALGLVVAGTLTSPGRALAAGDPALSELLARILPEPVDTVILQADLTAIVPGLPTPELADLLRAAADAESVGAASTYRFSTDSIRRALNRGLSAQGLLVQLRSRAEVPQPLAFMIEDVARRHAPLRVGRGAAYLSCGDPVTLARVLADPGTAALGLRALSDTVLVSMLGAEQVMQRLHELGYAPLPDASRPEGHTPRRARGIAASPEPPGGGDVTPAMAAAAVRALRATDRDTTPSRDGGGQPRTGPVPAMAAADVAAALRSAIREQVPVWIGYADPTGVAGDRRVEPVRLAGGYVTALDLRSETITTYALARITGVSR